MKNEQELKSLIQDVLHEIIGQDQNIENTINAGATNGESNPVSADSIPDITEVVISKQLLVPEPIDQEGYFNLKEKTPARIGVWHSGARYKTETALRFKADHAAAQDAVFSYVAEEFLEKNNIPLVSTICVDKDEFVTRPDFGRQFSDEVKEEIKKKCGNSQVQIVIGDGLSSAAIEANMEDTLNAIKQGLDIHNVKIGNDIFVKHCRVRAMDVIGDLTDADVVCLLIGERPGLVTAESMSAYIAYKPTVGMPEANRTVVSNIHQGGTPPAEAGAHIADLIKKMLDHKASGLNLSKLNV